MVTASSWFGEAVSFLLHVGALAGLVLVLFLVGLAVLGLVGWALNQVTSHVLRQAEETVREQQGTGVPALFTLVGTVGMAGSGLALDTLASFALTVAVALITFVSACLAQSNEQHRAARWLGIAGLFVPVSATAIAALASSDLSALDLEEQAFLAGGIVLSAAGVLIALVALRDEYVPGQ